MENQAERKMTIDMVAELCGVSKTTISRFLNGKYENMSAETREHIRQVIAEVDYRPNRSAQRLKASRSMLIGCVIGDISSPFSALLLEGITTVCEEAGYQVLFADSGENPRRERRNARKTQVPISGSARPESDDSGRALLLAGLKPYEMIQPADKPELVNFRFAD